MQKRHAQALCDEINALECPYVADLVPFSERRHPDFPFGVRVRHKPSGNEVGYAGQLSEGHYIVDRLKRQFTRTPA